MRHLKRLVVVGVIVGLLGATGVAYAATAKTPAEIAAGLTGKTVEDVQKEREAGKTYGTVANEAGKLDEFKAQMLEQRKVVLDQRVKDGSLTQEQADVMYNNMKNNQAACDGTGNGGFGRRNGQGFGMGNGQGNCAGAGMMYRGSAGFNK